MVSVQQVDSLLQAGAQFIGKASKTGKQCLLNTGDNGVKLFTTVDNDFNILLQKRITPTKYGFLSEVFNSRGQLVKCSELTRKRNNNLGLNSRVIDIQNFGGPFNRQNIENEQIVFSWYDRAAKNPMLETSHYWENTDSYKLSARNIITGFKIEDKRRFTSSTFDPDLSTPSATLRRCNSPSKNIFQA